MHLFVAQKFIKNGKNGPFWRDCENLKLSVKQYYQTGHFYRIIILGKCGTFWVIFKQCEVGCEKSIHINGSYPRLKMNLIFQPNLTDQILKMAKNVKFQRVSYRKMKVATNNRAPKHSYDGITEPMLVIAHPGFDLQIWH